MYSMKGAGQMTEEAIAKIDEELKNIGGDQKVEVVCKRVAETLKKFCEQDERFAQAVVNNEKTLTDCCTEATKDIKPNSEEGASDFEVYSKAVKFYLPDARVIFDMRIQTNAEDEKPGGVCISLADFL